jgi:hypothetical protein
LPVKVFVYTVAFVNTDFIIMLNTVFKGFSRLAMKQNAWVFKLFYQYRYDKSGLTGSLGNQ